MDWISEEVAIGNYLEAQDATLLKQHAFRSVLSLDSTLTPEQATKLGLAEIASYRLIDGAGNDLRVFRLAIDDLRRLAQSYALSICRSRKMGMACAPSPGRGRYSVERT